MRFIDKSIGNEEGRTITRNYVQKECSVNDGNVTRYQNVSYEGFCSRGYRNDMIDVLKKAQGNFCCYCMRDLSQNSGEITLEHIIPQKADSEDVEQYRALGIPSFDKKVLLLDTEFVKEENRKCPLIPIRLLSIISLIHVRELSLIRKDLPNAVTIGEAMISVCLYHCIQMRKTWWSILITGM